MDTEGEGYPRKVDIPQRGKPQFVDSIMRLQDIEDAPRFGRISGKSAALTASIYFLRFCNFSKNRQHFSLTLCAGYTIILPER